MCQLQLVPKANQDIGGHGIRQALLCRMNKALPLGVQMTGIVAATTRGAALHTISSAAPNDMH